MTAFYDRASFLTEMRLQFAYAPRWVYVRWADHHAKMAEQWAQRARDLGRPRYVWLAMRAAFLSGWFDATGGEYRYNANARQHMLITGITS